MNDVRPAVMPKARKDRLIIKELPDETLVYDLDTDKAHCLNETAAAVWKNCDGENSVAEINSALSKGSGVALDEGVVWLALDQLEKFKLLEAIPPVPAVLAGMSRRELMRRLGIATAITLPLITTMLVPTPASAASCGAACNNDGQCAGNPGCTRCLPPTGGSRTCQA